LSSSAPGQSPSRLWAVILAGGEGTRLAPLVRRIHPDGRPKQFAVLTGSRSLLRQTLDRAAFAVPRERTVIVATKSHAPFLADEFLRGDAAKVLMQPCDRGTAAGILLPIHWISWRDPDAVVAVFPSDHYVADDVAFMRHVEALAGAAVRHPSRIFLVGARPDGPETGYGWIEPGSELERGLRSVRCFREKPDAAAASACMERGGLWNTFVLVAKVSAILEAGRRALPALHATLEDIRLSAGTDLEERAIERAYAAASPANFSQSVLERSAQNLAVSTLPELSWSDWGTPERVRRTLDSQGIHPDWLQPLATSA
jgi:mannose-1-phosphate guanylyltransferase